MKCNVDAGFHNGGITTSRGWCIRDDTGQFIRAGTAWTRGVKQIYCISIAGREEGGKQYEFNEHYLRKGFTNCCESIED
ncbi:hypothetical protein L195_g036610 [Trifolium pratense]|uniref:Uncharacterized protein n=1 Tax=Trifolium pratense TaxID=57577 RepID=A0A2K3LPX9_TRIPR|nr:hypothetical protein L195_g036610 [Trifolium pratense]